MKQEYTLNYVGTGCSEYNSKPNEVVNFVIKNQLLDVNAWKHFVLAFQNDLDIVDNGWRGEYWGKMMRGACLTYKYSRNQELYNVLTDAVISLLDVQKERGCFSTYTEEKEFNGWDMWSRKYVLTGMQHYYDICSDEALKERITKALCRHADYLCEKIGNKEGQKDITQTSDFWLGVNSCSILESVLRLYDMTKVQKYLDFAEYIISTGGINHELNLVELALENKLMPYQYPENKAYETMSFFEGILCYYELFGKEEYLTAVKNFAEAVAKTDITVIGCSGCTHELFDNSAVKQTEPSEVIMQETCVTVTWMRLMARLHMLTGEAKYAERIEKSALNSLYGSINTHMLPQNKSWQEDGTFIGPFVFDSYAPLYNYKRGVGVGGSRIYPDGFHYGCCACIGSAGTAIYPLVSALESKNGIVLNSLWSGSVCAKTPSGNNIKINISGNFPIGGEITVKLGMEKAEKFEIKIRVPENNAKFECSQNGKIPAEQNGYITFNQEFKDGDEIKVILENRLTEEKLNGKTAFTYGILTLARDSAKENPEVAADLTETVELQRNGENLAYTLCEPQGEEMIRIKVKKADGTELLLTDFASCGKKWNVPNCLMTVWMNIK